MLYQKTAESVGYNLCNLVNNDKMSHQKISLANIFADSAAAPVVIFEVAAHLHLEMREAKLEIFFAEFFQQFVAVAEPTWVKTVLKNVIIIVLSLKYLTHVPLIIYNVKTKPKQSVISDLNLISLT